MTATASAVRKMKQKSWDYREERGDFIRPQVRAQSKWPDDPVLKGVSRRLSKQEHEAGFDVVYAWHCKSAEAERERTGRNVQGGELQRAGLLVYRYLLKRAWLFEEVFPTAAEIAKETGLKVATVHAAKAQLQRAGLLEWRHRALEVEDAAPDEPSIRQTSNLYRLMEIPARILAVASRGLQAAYRRALALTRIQAANRVKRARAKAAETEATIKRKPRSTLVTSEIARSLAASRAAAAGVSPVSKLE